jgi:hypothetical protein
MSGFAKRKRIFLRVRTLFTTQEDLPDGAHPHASVEIKGHFIAAGSSLVGRMKELQKKSTLDNEKEFLDLQISEMEARIEHLKSRRKTLNTALEFAAILGVSQALLQYEYEFSRRDVSER